MMANKDDINSFNDAMDAPTPLEEAMDAPTPMEDVDEDIDIDDEEELKETVEENLSVHIGSMHLINGELLRKGENGHADVYRFEDLCTKQFFILKLYPSGIKPDNGALSGLKYLTDSDIESFHLVPIHSIGWLDKDNTSQKQYYVLMKEMKGGSLDGLPSNTDLNTLKTIVESAARALYMLHVVIGVKHGDVKISNLFLNSKENGKVFLGDYDTLEFVGCTDPSDDAYQNDWTQLREMTKRFNVYNDPAFQSFLNQIETTCPPVSYDEILHFIKVQAHLLSNHPDCSFIGSMQSYGIMHLLEDRGFQQEAQWIKDGFSEDKGCVPYSKYTAGWKALYALLGKDDPPRYYGYRFKGDIRQADRKWVLDELHNGHLKEWLAMFFHENPRRDFSEQYYYESEVERYLEFIRELDPDDENVVRLDAARDSILSGTKSFTNWKWGIWLTQGVCGLLYAIPALLLIGWLLFKGMPFDANPMTPTFATGSLAVGAIIAVALFFIFNDDTFSSGCGCVVSAFVGAVIMLLLMWGLVSIMDSLLPFIPWVIVALMLGLSVLVYFMIFSDDLKGASVNPQSDPDMWLVQPLYYAFDTSQQGYIYRQASDYDDLSNQFRSGLKKMVLMMALPILVAWGLWLGYKSITPDLGGTKLTTVQDRLDNMAGDWTGTFGEKKATMQVLCTHRDSFKIALTVEAQQPVTQTFTGELDGLLDVDLENDTPDDDILDGSVELSINYKSDSVLYGKFRDNLTEKKTNISFKKVKEENDSVQ